MSWLQLDPESLAARAQAAGAEARLPSLAGSVGRGAIGFLMVSVAGFSPWALFGRWLHRAVGEVGMYLACMVVFIGLSGWLLHRLIIGPGSLLRFYKLFSTAFAAYSAGWIAGWMLQPGHLGSIVGLLAGTAIMGWILARAFDAREWMFKVIAILFVLNALGYFIGGWAEGYVRNLHQPTVLGLTVAKKVQARTAMLLWGVFYGLGFGAGLGWVFYLCQTRARALLRSPGSNALGKGSATDPQKGL